MFRICTVTFDHTVNYGSCLQSYALMRAVFGLKINEEDGICYDVVPVRKLKGYPIHSKNYLIRTLKESIVQSVGYHFRKFAEKYMHFAKCSSVYTLKELNSQYDCFICGSDVIWNPDHNHNNDAYFLTFAEKYSFAYAASFGKTELSQAYLNTLQNRLSHLRQISVREADAVRIIEENTNLTAVHTLDPTLLLTSDKWNEIAEDPKIEDDYIFVYLTHLFPAVERFIAKLHQQTGLKVIYAPYGPKLSLKFKTYPPSPEKWIGLIRGAKYVVTNSFHGTAFCALYHKIFFTLVQGEFGKGIYVRMYDFLKELGLEERIYNDVPESIDLAAPFYNGVDDKLESRRKESLEFLRENLEQAYKEKMERESD